MRKRIDKIWGNAKNRLSRLWKWARRPKKKRKEKNRWQALKKWANDKQKAWKKRLDRRRRKHRSDAAKEAAKAKRQWWIKRHTVYRRKYKKAKRKYKKSKNKNTGHWQSWMANGRNDYVVPAVKDFLARGVLGYGLYVTSMRRTYVPPGGSSTSYHLQGKAGDIAGSRMADFQRSEYSRNLGNGNCLELFGPDNAKNLKYGRSLYLAEGTGLENLHDTHVHGAFN
jgi:hypothetical protein